MGVVPGIEKSWEMLLLLLLMATITTLVSVESRNAVTFTPEVGSVGASMRMKPGRAYRDQLPMIQSRLVGWLVASAQRAPFAQLWHGLIHQ